MDFFLHPALFKAISYVKRAITTTIFSIVSFSTSSILAHFGIPLSYHIHKGIDYASIISLIGCPSNIPNHLKMTNSNDSPSSSSQMKLFLIFYEFISFLILSFNIFPAIQPTNLLSAMHKFLPCCFNSAQHPEPYCKASPKVLQKLPFL